MQNDIGSMRVNKDIPLGISKVESLLREHRLFIIDDCKELLDEAGFFHQMGDVFGGEAYAVFAGSAGRRS